MLRYQKIVILSLLLVGLSAILFLSLYSDTTQSFDEDLPFNSITYNRLVLDTPRPIIAHYVHVDLTSPHIQFLVTPNTIDNGERISARTTSEFLEEFDVQIAINGGFFGWSTEDEPQSDEIVTLHGLTASQGVQYTEGYAPPGDYNTVYISENNQVEFDNLTVPIYNALSGYWMIVQNGAYQSINTPPEHAPQTHPRTALALDREGNALIFIMVEGRQPGIAEGVTIEELAHFVIDAGGYTALNLDGGGSVTLAIEDENGNAQLLTTPVSANIIGRERAIANHLGIYTSRPHN